MTKKKKVTVNTAKDYLNFAAHGLAAAGILAGVTLAVGSPVISGIAIAISLGLNTVAAPYIKKAFGDALPDPETGESAKKDFGLRRSKSVQNKLQNVFENIRHYSEKLGLPEVPSFHFLDDESYWNSRSEGKSRSWLRGELKDYLRYEFNSYANAAAFSHEQNRVILTEPLARTLTQEELDAVTGHELGHIAARHSLKNSILSYMTSPARVTAALFSAVVFFSSLKNAGIMWGGSVLGNMLSRGYDLARVYNDPSYDHEKGWEHKKMKNIFRKAATAGLAVAFGAPEVLLVMGVSLFAHEGAQLINKSYSRRNEFQADRIGAAVSGEPGALISGLEKVKEHNLSFERGMFFEREKQKGGLSAVFNRAKELYQTHPNNERRGARLEKMALALEAAAP